MKTDEVCSGDFFQLYGYSIWDWLNVVVHFISGSVLAIWARYQYINTRDMVGMYLTRSYVIFPIYFVFLSLYGFGMLIRACSFLFDDSEPTVTEYNVNWEKGMAASCADAIMVLILSNSLSSRVLLRSVSAFLLSFGTYFLTTWLDGIWPWSYISFRGSLALVYVTLWVTPNSVFLPRRRAARIWAQYLGVGRALDVSGQIMLKFGNSNGRCVGNFYTIFLSGARFAYVSYSVFVSETRYWHGNLDEYEGARESRVCTIENGVVELTCFMPPEPASTYPSLRTNSTTTSTHDLAPVTSLLRDYHLSGQAAEALTGVAENLSISARSYERDLTGPLGKTRRAPILDFTRVRILKSRLLGSGSSAKVFEGRWCQSRCAIKVLFNPDINAEDIGNLCMEAALLHSLRGVSPHVVALYGVCLMAPSLCLVLELCSEGSLSDVLYPKHSGRATNYSSVYYNSRRQASQRPLDLSAHLVSDALGDPDGDAEGNGEDFEEVPWADKLELALGVCKGVDALATLLPGYSHNDLKSMNFLVHCERAPSNQLSTTAGYVAKLSDVEFLSKGVTPPHLLRHHTSFTPNWIAPELLSQYEPVSPASDVYSLGCVLYEILERRIPYEELPSSAAIVDFVKRGGRPVLPSIPNQPECEYCRLVTMAWAQDAQLRPTVRDMVLEMESICIAQGVLDPRRATSSST